MATMIPPVVPREYPSEGEREVFRRLETDPGAEDWIVLHSLGLARHERRVAGEVDFVVIIPTKGVLCLEVKGASDANLRRDPNGLWFYGPEDKGDPRGPFRQAAEAMHSLRGQLLKARPDFTGTQFSSAVVFPFARFKERSVEWNDWEVIDTLRLRSGPISRILLMLMDVARAHLLEVPEAPRLIDGIPTREQCLEIRDTLRGAFEAPVDRRARADALDAELRQYTAEQFLALDAMTDNPRTIFNGPAGVGKTLLAIEAAARARAAGRRVLLVCYNRLLGGWLEDQTASLKPEVAAGTIHKHMLAVSGLGRVPAEAGPDFWETRLPELACDRLLEMSALGGNPHMFDELIVDEGQDILREPFLDFLDLSLHGGWASGSWRMFGDFDYGAVYPQATVSLQDFRARRAGGAPIYSLRVNCRNTPLVAEWVHLLAGLTPRYQRVLRPDDRVQPEIRFYSGSERQRELLVETLGELERLGFHGQDIVVLSARADGPCAQSVVIPPWRDRLRPIDRARGGYVGWGSVRVFKGLEAPAVIVSDIETISSREAKDISYIAITRVLQRLIILAHERVRDEAVQALIAPRA